MPDHDLSSAEAVAKEMLKTARAVSEDMRKAVEAQQKHHEVLLKQTADSIATLLGQRAPANKKD